MDSSYPYDSAPHPSAAFSHNYHVSGGGGGGGGGDMLLTLAMWFAAIAILAMLCEWLL
jgi:uncharacterized membrane protein